MDQRFMTPLPHQVFSIFVVIACLSATEVHITGGLSNISYGLPQRHIINRTFVTLMMAAGMDSAILDPLDKKIMASIRTADMLLGYDSYCMEFLNGVRSGAIEN